MTDSGAGSDTFTTLRGALETLDWEDRSGAHGQAAKAFATIGADRTLAALSAALPAAVDVERSVEKTTHYKWFLGAASDQSFELWLHEYKPSSLRRTGHATVAHNHRFWLTSLVLRGGFTDSRFRRDDASPSLLSEIERRTLAADETMVIDAEEIHALSGLEDGTMTLVVQSAPVRHYSEVFEDGTRKVYFDLEAKLTGLRDSLRRRG